MMAQSEAQFVTFAMGEEIFAVPVEVVREILDHEHAFKIPQGPDYLLGLRDVRGQGVPIIDLRRRLGMAATVLTHHTRVLVLDIPCDGRVLTLGMMADKVFEVTPFRLDQIDSAPQIGVRWESDYIQGVVRRTNDFVVIIDLSRLFAHQGEEIQRASLDARQVA